MTAAERGVLLLCAQLENGDRPLTMAQFRELSKRVNAARTPDDGAAPVRAGDLQQLGYTKSEAVRIEALLNREEEISRLIDCCEKSGIHPIARTGSRYPLRLSRTLSLSCPPLLFAKGEMALLDTQCVSLVGSRRLSGAGRLFAEQVGRLAAREGYTLCSGGAEGADLAAQEACLSEGGSVIVFTPGNLLQTVCGERTLLLSEGGIALSFSAARAMARNRLIHAMGEKTLVAQTDHGFGGTWNGTLENLRHGFSPVFIHDDGSAGAQALAARGAVPIGLPQSLRALESDQLRLSL